MKSKAFTMIELIIFMGLLSVFIYILGDLFSVAANLRLETQSTALVEQESSYLVARLTHDIRQAQSLVTPALPGQSDSTLALTIAGQNHTYSLSDSRLRLSVGANDRYLSSYNARLTQFQVTRLGTSVHITMTLTSVPTDLIQNAFTKSYQFTVGLR